MRRLLLVLLAGWVVVGCAGSSRPVEGPTSIRTEADFQQANREARDLMQGRLEKIREGGDLTQEDKDKIAQALSRYEGMILFNPRGFGSYYGAGLANWALGRHEQAVVRFQGFLETAPELPGPDIRAMIADGHQVKALSHAALNQWNEAEAEATEAIKLEPDTAEYLVFRASARIQLLKLKEARADLDRAKKLDPNNVRAQELEKLLQAAG